MIFPRVLLCQENKITIIQPALGKMLPCTLSSVRPSLGMGLRCLFPLFACNLLPQSSPISLNISSNQRATGRSLFLVLSYDTQTVDLKFHLSYFSLATWQIYSIFNFIILYSILVILVCLYKSWILILSSTLNPKILLKFWVVSSFFNCF